MSPKSNTALKIEYSELSKDYDFRDDIESALENDYAANPGLYYLEVLEHLKLRLRLAPEMSPQCVLEVVEKYRK